jgi:HK97 family phage major capsid protein
MSSTAAAGPFAGSYGASSSQTPVFGGAPLWGLRVALSSVVGPGTALIGSFSQAAHIWRRGGVSVEATNSHSDHFVKNLVALRAEERLGLGVFRPAGFVQVTGLS